MNSRLLKKLWFLNNITRNRQIYLANSTFDFNQPNKFGGYVRSTSKTLSAKITILLFGLLSFFSCQQETTITIPTEMEIAVGFQKGVFITNEGNFNSGNASVTFYDLETQAVQEKIFETANNQSLGDVLQSMTVIEDKAYLVLNNSQKVEVVNLNDFSSVGTIGDLITPRYLTPVNETTAYVSDIFGAAISVVDLTSQQEMAKIPFGSASEEMVKISNEMFVAQPSLSINTKKSSNQIFVINTNTNQVMDSIQVGYNPSEIEVDANNKLWVICNGERNFGQPDKLGGLYKVNPNTREVELALPFTDSPVSFAPRLVMNGEKDKLYFLKLDVFELSIDATALPTTPIIPANDREIYGIGVNPSNGNIYIGESGNFVQRGTVTIHDSNGNELSSFRAGVGVNGFYFN